MKKVLALVVATGLIAAASFASAATIKGSKHDLSPTGTASFSGLNSQICVYCHAPHGAQLFNPLWNRTNPGGASFTLYSGVNMASKSNKSGFTADNTSLFCMSCHDGGTQMDAIFNKGALTNHGAYNQPLAGDAGFTFATNKIITAAKLGSDLRGTHPVNFIVTTADTQSDLWIAGATAATTVMGGGAGTATNAFPLFKLSGNRATNRSLECGSCHAVHDSQYSPFLRVTMKGSTLCLGCHNK